LLNEKLIGEFQDENDDRSGILNQDGTYILIKGISFCYARRAKIYLADFSQRLAKAN
jgi:hypothetical protein